jgi:hypothetical protein
VTASSARPGTVAGALVFALSSGTALAQMVTPTYVLPTGSTKGGPPPTWHFRVAAGGGWYDNPFFVGGAPDTSYSADGTATLSHEYTWRSGSFGLSGNGGVIYYPELSAFNQPTYGGAATLQFGSRRSRFTLSQTYQRSNTRYLSELDTAQGLPLPTSGYVSANSLMNWEYQFSRSWQFGVNGRFFYRDYDDPILVGGNEASGGARLGTRAGRKGLVYLSYQFTSSLIQENLLHPRPENEGRLRSHQVLAGYLKQPQSGWGYELAGGINYIESVQKVYPAGRASISHRGRREALEAHYERTYGQAFGYGSASLADIAGAYFSWAIVRRVTLQADYNFGYRRDPENDSNTITSWIASAGLNWAVGGGVGFGVRYIREHNDTFARLPQAEPGLVTGNRVSASLSYGVDWR